jgi:hypothetical protein
VTVSCVVVVVVVVVGTGSSVAQDVRNVAAAAARIEARMVILFIA